MMILCEDKSIFDEVHVYLKLINPLNAAILPSKYKYNAANIGDWRECYAHAVNRSEIKIAIGHEIPREAFPDMCVVLKRLNDLVRFDSRGVMLFRPTAAAVFIDGIAQLRLRGLDDHILWSA